MLRPRSLGVTLAVAFALWQPTPTQATTFSQVGSITEASLPGASPIIASGDGRHLYVRGVQTIAVFERTPATGALSLIDVEENGVGGVTGLVNNSTMVLSPDETTLMAGAFPWALLVFARDAGTGELSFEKKIGFGVYDVEDIAFSPDSRFAYVISDYEVEPAIPVVERDGVTGEWALTDTIETSGGARAAAMSPDGLHLYTGDSAGSPVMQIHVYARNPDSGHLSTRQNIRFQSRARGPDDVTTATDLLVNPDGGAVYALGGTENSPWAGTEIAVFKRDAATGKLASVHQVRLACDNCCDAGGDDEYFGLAMHPDGARLFAFGPDIATFLIDPVHTSLNATEAQPPSPEPSQSFAISADGLHAYRGVGFDGTIEIFGVGASPEAPLPKVCRLPGRSISIRNAGSGTEIRSGKVVAKDPETPFGVQGSRGDPTCNEDAPGTARATIRFWSDASGEDTGELPLPCEKWSPAGPEDSNRRGFSYRDPLKLDGPCTSVRVRGEGTLKAVCSNRGAAPFPFDLTEGVDQQVVNARLTIGNLTYCVAFEDHKGKDGSDGRKFLGKRSDAPGSCS